MANPRQRRKVRSSSYRPVSHSKNAKRNLKKMPPIRAPKVLQEAWNKRKTVRQNYAALGLIHDLNPSASGGAEIIEVDVDQEDARASGPESSSSRSDVRPNGSRSGDSIPKGYGRIIRDEDGNILRIELAEEEKNLSPAGNKNVDMEQLEPELDEAVKEKWIQDLGANGKRVLLKDNDRKDITGGEFNFQSWI
ncbi:ribosome biogenesis protein nop16 [Moniliophthora roreri MCA 2997]|uniref:Nucleolar protein 16 n=1 Tax=Moniliophthora roreri (strain MCA 2997) TaxID=1381753 RepID=V2XK61_MONRO|nr:ribosome biogenesis protein nop16 [Moniliophthora roreri MCA 2997]